MISENRWQRYGAALVYLANGVLILSLLAARSARLAGDTSPYFAPAFIVLLAGTLLLAGLTTGLVRSGRLPGWLKSQARPARWGIISAWIIGSFVVAGFIPAFVTFMRPYILPFILWLTLGNLGLAALGVSAGGKDEPPATPESRRSQLVKNTVFVLLSILIPLLVIEIGLRIWFTYLGSDYEHAIYTYSAEEIASQGAFVGMPYINFGLSPHYRGHNSLGYRGEEIPVTKPEGVFRIVALGGSTTYGTSLDWWQAYPAQLQSILRDEYGYTNVQVVNAGAAAYASWDTLVNFEFRVLDLDPDMVIVYDAINDVVARLVDPAYYDGLNQARGIWRAEFPNLSPSVLYRYIAFNLLGMPNPGQLDAALYTQSDIRRCDARDFCDNLGMTPQEVLDANPPVYFERNMRNLIVLAQANGVEAVFSSWAYYPDPMEGRIDPFMTYPHIQNAVAEHNAITKQLAEDYVLPYYDLMGNMPHNVDYWTDGLHMTPAGAHEQAERYAAFLVENNLIPPPENN